MIKSTPRMSMSNFYIRSGIESPDLQLDFDTLSFEEIKNYRSKHSSTYEFILRVASVRLHAEINKQIFRFILTINPNERKKQEIIFMMHQTKDWEFFQSIKGIENEKNAHEYCCQNMRIETYETGSIIFEQGEQSDNFYFTIDGEVNVYKKRNENDVKIQIDENLSRLPQMTTKEKKTSIRRKIVFIKKQRFLRKLLVPIKAMRVFNLNKTKEEDSSYYQKRIIIRMLINQNKEYERDDRKTNQLINKILGGLKLETVKNIDFFFRSGVQLQTYMITLGPGTIFGELGILFNKPRSATVLAKTNVTLGVLSSSVYSYILKDRELKKMNERLDFFEKYLFQSLPRDIIIKNQYNFVKKAFQLHQYFYKQGDPINEIYLIKKGSVDIVSERQQTKTKVASLGIGCLFGEIEIFNNQLTRINSAISSSNQCKVYALSVYIFQRVIEGNKELKKSIQQKSLLRIEWQDKIFNELVSAKKERKQVQVSVNTELPIKTQLAYKLNNVNRYLLNKGIDKKLEKQIEDQIKQQSTKTLISKIEKTLQSKLNIANLNPIKSEENQKHITKVLKEIQRSSIILKKPLVYKANISAPSPELSNEQKIQMYREIRSSKKYSQNSIQSKLVDTKDIANYLLKSKLQSQRSSRQSISQGAVHSLWNQRERNASENSNLNFLITQSRALTYREVSTNKPMQERDRASSKIDSPESSLKMHQVVPSKHNMFRLRPQKDILWFQNYKTEYFY